MLLDILLIFLAAAGILLVVWCVAGLFLAPFFDRSSVLVCCITGGAKALEQKVAAFAWLRGSKITGGQMVLVDCGLEDSALIRIEHLRRRYEWLSLRRQGERLSLDGTPAE